MARSRVDINRATLQRYLDGEFGVEEQLETEAAAVEARAKASAAVRSGAYRDSIHIETDRTDRMVKRVVSDVPYALVLEARDGTLARALD